MLFPSHRSGWINYWQVPLTGGEPLPVHAEASDQTDGVLSPGGEKFAFVANTNGATRLVVVDLAGGAARVLVDPATGRCLKAGMVAGRQRDRLSVGEPDLSGRSVGGGCRQAAPPAN